MFANWIELAGEITEINLAAQRVVGLRLMRLVGGGSIGKREARRMVVEKIGAAAQAGALMATGCGLGDVLRLYSRAVKANENRLRRKR